LQLASFHVGLQSYDSRMRGQFAYGPEKQQVTEKTADCMQHVLPIRELRGVTPHMTIKTTYLNRGKENISAFCSRCPWEMRVYVFGALKTRTPNMVYAAMEQA